jgi:carbonic anhydrase
VTVVDTLVRRNERFAAHHTELGTLPALGLCIVTCPDPRVDPVHVLGLEPGDAAVVRAAAGRVSPIIMDQLLLLQAAGTAAGQPAVGLELILMTHTDCGVASLLVSAHRAALAALLGYRIDELDAKSIDDPYGAIRIDLDALANDRRIASTLSVTGLVYDVHTGRVQVIERRSPLRQDQL